MRIKLIDRINEALASSGDFDEFNKADVYLSALLKRYVENNDKLSINELKEYISTNDTLQQLMSSVKDVTTFYRGLHFEDTPPSNEEIIEAELSKSYVSVTDKKALAIKYAKNKGSWSKDKERKATYGKVIVYEVPQSGVVAFLRMMRYFIDFEIDEDDIIIEPKKSEIIKILDI